MAKFVQNHDDCITFFIVIAFSVLPYWFYLMRLPYPHVQDHQLHYPTQAAREVWCVVLVLT